MEQKTLTRRRCAGVARLPLHASGALSRHALIIGTSRYRWRPFSQLEAPSCDLQGLHRVLSAPNIGGFEAANPLCEQPAFHLAMELESFFRDRERDDVLLLCITGHVLIDEHGAPCLITHGTERARWRSTVIDFSFLRDVMDGCRSRQQVVIIDAAVGSFGAGGPPLDASVDIEAALGGRERVVITASNTIRYRLNDNANGGCIATARAPALIPRIVRGLATGEADLDADGRVSLDDLIGYIRGGGPQPRGSLDGGRSALLVARSVAASPRQPSPTPAALATDRLSLLAPPRRALERPGAATPWNWAAHAASSVASWLAEHVGR